MILLPGIAWGNGYEITKWGKLTVSTAQGDGSVYIKDDDGKYTKTEHTKSEDDSGDGSEPSSLNISFDCRATPGKGYKFDGWREKKDSTTNFISTASDYTYTFAAASDDKNNPTSKTLHGYFSLISYNITYELGGGTNNSSNPDTYTKETEDITLGNPTRPGYTFTKWTLTSMEGDWTEPIGSEITTITKGHFGAITLTAVWDANGYKIKFEPNGGTFNGEIQNPLPYKTSDDTISLPEITREGFTFTGWTASFEPGDSDHGGWDISTGKYGNGKTITTENKYYGNVTLTAGWEKEPDPSSIKVSITGLKGDDHAIFNISYEKQGQTVNQQIAIHEYAIVKIPGGVSSVTVMPSKWTEKTYTITPPGETTQNVTAGNTTFFNFSATPKSGQNIFETSREF